MGVGDDQPHAAQASADQLAKERAPELQVLGRAYLDAYHLALTAALDPDRDQHRHRDHAPVLAHLLKGGVQEEVGVVAIEAAIRKAWT